MWTAPYALYSGSVGTSGVTTSALDLLEPQDKHAVSVAITASTAGNVFFVLEGSLDGTNWYWLTGLETSTTLSTTLYSSTTVARYVRTVTYTDSGSATVSITGVSGTE